MSTPVRLASRRAHAAKNSRLWRVEDALLETAERVKATDGDLGGEAVAAVILIVVQRKDGSRAIDRTIAGHESSAELVTHVLAVAQRDHLGD